VRNAIRIFQDYLDDLFYKKMVVQIKDKDAEKEFRKVTWALHVEISMPLWEPEEDHNKEYRYKEWQGKKTKWLSSVKRKARDAWGIISSLFLKGQDEADIEYDTFTTQEISGFRVLFKQAPNSNQMSVIKESIDVVNRNLGEVFPRALVRKPILIFENQGLDKGGEYDASDRTIVLNLNVYGSNPKRGAQIIVHELTHDIYEFLSGSDIKYWRAAIIGDYGDLKLSDIVKNWPDERAGISSYFLAEYLQDKNPILALQIQSLAVQHRAIDYRNRDEAEADLANGDKVFKVPNSPITSYATKNEEEAFCEAFSYYVVYGARAVLPIVRLWLRTILPSAKIVSSKDFDLEYGKALFNMR